MKNLKSFLKQCIAEVIVEPTKKPNRLLGKKMASLIKQCIAEVIVEPLPRKKKIYGNPKHLRATGLVKECIIEVLKENLSAPFESKCPTCGTPDSKCNCKLMDRVRAYIELRKKAEAGKASPEEIQFLAKERLWVNALMHRAGYGVQGGMYPREEQQEAFDPTSQGPNIPQENPYPEMNAKMRMMEVEPPQKKSKITRKSIKESNVIYKDRQGGQWVYWIDADGNHHIIHPNRVQKYLKQGYRIVPLEPWNDPKSMKDFPDKGIMEIGPHGRYAQQAGATPFRSPGDTSIVEYDDHETTITKVKREVFPVLEKIGFRHLGDEPKDYMEYYLNGFVTVSIYISYDDNSAHIERYYDSEMVDNIPGHHIDAKIPIPEKYDPAMVQKLIKLCSGLKKRAAGDESIFGGIDDIEEAKTQSTNIEWPCPYCGQSTNISVEIESPSDYIAGADCEHCGKEISDPRLDQKIYSAVIDYYSGKADYLKDTH